MFLVWTTKDMEDGGRSEEKRFYAINSKQKSTKNLVLVSSFLTCWLAGPFCRNLPLSTNFLEDGFRLSGILSMDFFWDRDILGGDGECFPCTNQRFGGVGKVRGEEALRCQFKAKSTKNSSLVGSFLTFWLTGPFCWNLPLSTNDLEDGSRINRILVGNCLEGQDLFWGGGGECFLA